MLDISDLMQLIASAMDGWLTIDYCKKNLKRRVGYIALLK